MRPHACGTRKKSRMAVRQLASAVHPEEFAPYRMAEPRNPSGRIARGHASGGRPADDEGRTVRADDAAISTYINRPVEVPGIEPGSIGGSAGLLRAYSRTSFSAPPIPGTGRRQAQPRKFPSLTRGLSVRFSPLDYAAARSGASLGRQGTAKAVVLN